MTRTAAVYARDSRDDGTESFGIDSQVRYGLSYAEKYGFTVPDDYTLEEEWTGRDWSRPKFDTLKQLIEFRHINAVVVYKVNRISRIDYHALMFLRDFCFRHKVELHIVEWGRQVKDDSNDVILFGLQAQFGHIERDDIVKRTQRGRIEKVQQGIFLGQGTTVYGYEKTGIKKNTALIVILEESAIIKLIFGMFVQKNVQITDIARYLNAQNIPSPSQRLTNNRRKSDWNHNSVLRILRDPRYTGEFYAFRYISSGKSGVLRPKEDWIKQQFPQLAIIDRDTFNAAQEIIDSRKNRYTFLAKYDYLFAKRLWCACGHKAGVQAMKDGERIHQYYRCAHKRKIGHHNSTCKIPYLNSITIDNSAWNEIEYFIRNPNVVLEKIRTVQQQQQEEHRAAMITVQTLNDIRKDYTARVNKLYDDYDRNLIPESIYLQRKKPLDEGLATAEKLYAEQQAILDQNVLSDGDIRHIIKECTTFADILDAIGTLDFEDRRKTVELFNITGTFSIKQDMIMLTLSIHGLPFKDLILDSRRFCSLMNVYKPVNIALQSPISLHIIVGRLKSDSN